MSEKNNGGAVARRPEDTLRQLLLSCKGQIALALPKYMTADRMIRVAVTACKVTPELLECSPMSIVSCVMRAAELGLELSGPLGQAYLVPFRNKHSGGHKEAQLLIGYRGMQQLAFRSGLVSNFPAHVVREGDDFRYQYGTHQFLHHVPKAKPDAKVTHVYAAINLLSGATDFEVMTFEELQAHKRKYVRGKSLKTWDENFEEMAKKTLVRKLAKRVPVSVEMQTAAAVDEQAERGAQEPHDRLLDLPELPEIPFAPPAAEAPEDEPEPAGSRAEQVAERMREPGEEDENA